MTSVKLFFGFISDSFIAGKSLIVNYISLVAGIPVTWNKVEDVPSVLVCTRLSSEPILSEGPMKESEYPLNQTPFGGIVISLTLKCTNALSHVEVKIGSTVRESV